MGRVVISVDAELGWGFVDFDEPPERRVERARWGWNRLVDLFERFDVPATWAVVGHLYLRECDGRHDGHPVGRDWFTRERGAWRDRPDLRFGPDLIASLDRSPVDHEIGSHTFSHVELGDPATTREVAAAELDRSVDVAADAGHDVDSFVFPRNDVGHLDAMADAGFRAYRGPAPGPEPGRARKLATATVAPESPRIVRPSVDERGLVNVPASLYLFSFQGLARDVVAPVFGDPIVNEVRRGLDAVAERDGVFHLWLHPNNLTDATDCERMAAVLREIDERRPAVEVATMGEVADRTLDSGTQVAARGD